MLPVSAINFPMRFSMLLLLFCAVSVWGQAGKGHPAVSKALYELFTTEWDYDMQQRPEQASTLGAGQMKAQRPTPAAISTSNRCWPSLL